VLSDETNKNSTNNNYRYHHWYYYFDLDTDTTAFWIRVVCRRTWPVVKVAACILAFLVQLELGMGFALLICSPLFLYVAVIEPWAFAQVREL
jgi:hypothetical protein